MGKIRIIREANLGNLNTQTNDKVYPVTTTEAVFVPQEKLSPEDQEAKKKLTDHIHPRVVLSEADWEKLTPDNLQEGYDYMVYEEEE